MGRHPRNDHRLLHHGMIQTERVSRLRCRRANRLRRKWEWDLRLASYTILRHRILIMDSRQHTISSRTDTLGHLPHLEALAATHPILPPSIPATVRPQ